MDPLAPHYPFGPVTENVVSDRKTLVKQPVRTVLKTATERQTDVYLFITACMFVFLYISLLRLLSYLSIASLLLTVPCYIYPVYILCSALVQ